MLSKFMVKRRENVFYNSDFCEGLVKRLGMGGSDRTDHGGGNKG